MRNANWTRILTILLSLLALYALLAVAAGILQRFITPLLLIVLASIIAFVLTPVVDLLHRRLRIFRWMAILITYLLLICLLGTLGYFMTTPLIDQTKALTDAIKNPSSQNLHAVKAFEADAAAYVSRATIYETDVAQSQTDPTTGDKICLPNPGPCANQVISGVPGEPPFHVYFAPCYAAYFLRATGYPGPPSPIWSGTGCGSNKPNLKNVLYANWLSGHSLAHPFKTVRPIAGPLLSRLTRDFDRLALSSVQSSAGGESRPQSTTIPTTQVPSSYAKPVQKNLTKLRKAVHVAVADVRSESGGTTYATDAAKVLREASSLAAAAESLLHKVKTTPIVVMAFQNFFDQHHIPVNVGTTISSAINKVRGQSTSFLNNAVAILTGTVNVIFDVIIILIMSLYLLADGARFISWLIGLVPEANREQAWFFVGSLNRVLGGYIRGQLIVAITIGILAGVGCWVIGVPYALLLGIFAFLAESIPVMGPVIASVPAVLVALFTLPLLRTLFVVGWFIVIQQIEQNVVGPRITGRAVGIHPVVAMVAVIIGLEIGGIWGAFLAVPVAGIIFVMVGEGYSYFVLRKPLPTAEMPDSLESSESGARGA